MHQFKVQHQLPISIDKAWAFFSSPMNLAKITPPSMGFEILGAIGEHTYSGQIIQYKIKPLLGIPMKWVTEITHVSEGNYFVDEQRFGPYSMWHHEHFFEENDQGVLMTDIVTYKVPGGLIGRCMNWLFIGEKVESIFRYREARLNQIFNA